MSRRQEHCADVGLKAAAGEGVKIGLTALEVILRLSLMKRIHLSSLALLLISALMSPSAQASERRFGYTYPTLTSPAGEVELENWLTWKSRPGAIRSLEVRHELEIGLTDKTQIGFSAVNWKYDARARGSSYQNTSVELIHNLSNPATDFLGSAVYGEISAGERSAAFEGKLLLEKRIGRWVIGWNGVFESEWEGDKFADFQESSGELGQTFGIAYDLTKSLSCGVEAVHKTSLEKWHAPRSSQLYCGPNVTFRRGHFFTGLTALFQTTNRTGDPSLQSRLMVGVEF